MKTENKIKVKNITEELYNKKELDNIHKNLLTIPELQKVLKLGSSSIYNLFKKGKLQPIRFRERFYIPKQQVYQLLNPLEEQKKNTDMKLDKEYKEFLGLEEDRVIPAKITDEKSKKQILQDNKTKTQNKPNRDTLKLKIKQ